MQFLSLEKKEKKEYFKENQLLDWLTQILLAIKYLHNKNILHCDIKLENIFIDEKNNIKLGDFGICNFLINNNYFLAQIINSKNDEISINIGTPYYISPEMCHVHNKNIY